jgi:hypothetical protein
MTTYNISLEVLLAETGVSDGDRHLVSNWGPAGSSSHLLSVV